ncbi:hypothetical protein H4R35_006056 [Dimargaris xerosporica]|nr:hypothetical protein H4R35_006056 [Dimargaris xerosporica]
MKASFSLIVLALAAASVSGAPTSGPAGVHTRMHLLENTDRVNGGGLTDNTRRSGNLFDDAVAVDVSALLQSSPKRRGGKQFDNAAFARGNGLNHGSPMRRMDKLFDSALVADVSVLNTSHRRAEKLFDTLVSADVNVLNSA